MRINSAVTKTTYTIKNPTLLADPVTILLPIIISRIYDKSTVQPCQVTGNPHPIPYFFAGNHIFFLFFSIDLGCLFGRSEPGADWTNAYEFAAELKRRFVLEHGTTNCGALLATFGTQENMIRCKQLSGEVACMLAEILEEHCMVSDTTGRKTKKADG